MTPLTVPEAHAILIADEALGFSFEERLATGQTFGIEAREAWTKLVESTTDRIAVYERPPAPAPKPYPGGNEPDVQTLFVEAVADARRGKPVMSVLACREGSSWVVQAIEQDVASQGESLLGALADLGRMFDAQDLLRSAENNIAPNPRAPAEYDRALSVGHYVGVLPLGTVRVAQVYIGISPFERRTP